MVFVSISCPSCVCGPPWCPGDLPSDFLPKLRWAACFSERCFAVLFRPAVYVHDGHTREEWDLILRCIIAHLVVSNGICTALQRLASLLDADASGSNSKDDTREVTKPGSTRCFNPRLKYQQKHRLYKSPESSVLGRAGTMPS